MEQSNPPALVRFSEGLGPLPEAYGWFDVRGEPAGGYTADQMRAYAAQQVAAERERLRALVGAMLDG